MRKTTTVPQLVGSFVDSLKDVDQDKFKYDLVDVPVCDQNHFRSFRFRERDQDQRIFVGVDCETTMDIGQKPISIQIAQRVGPHEWEALYIKNGKSKGCQDIKTFEIQGEKINVVVKQTPNDEWGQLINNLLSDPQVTLCFFNILFDLPLIYPEIEPAKTEKLDQYFYFRTRKQPVYIQRLPERRVLIQQKEFEFFDTQTVSGILYDETSLAGASDRILNLRKLPADYGSIHYAVWDAVLTSMLGEKLDQQLRTMKMNIRPDHVRSSATFSKYLLTAMGIKRPHFENGEIYPHWESYFGGKIETHPEYTKQTIRGPLVYADISGQYAQSMKQTQIYDLLTCQGIMVTKKKDFDQDQLMRPNPLNARICVKAKLENAVVPVKTTSVNLYPTTKGTGFYMLPDLWSAKLLNPDCKIEILEVHHPEAIGGRQKLRSQHGLDPYNLVDDLIQKRRTSKDLDQDQFYKAVINTMYGITAEGTTGAYDKMGAFGNPVVASTITSYARYLLTIGEAKLIELGGVPYYIHTDSLFMDNEFYPQVKKELFKHKIDLTVKGRGNSLLTISAGKYGLYQDRNGKKVAKDQHGSYLASLHGLTRPIKMIGKNFISTMFKNWTHAFQCYDQGLDPMNYQHFEGVKYKRIESVSVQTVHSYKTIKNEFIKAGLDPDLVRLGMFYFVSWTADGTRIITPTVEKADQLGEQTLELSIKKHFISNDNKYNYREGKRWEMDLDAERRQTVHRFEYMTDD